MSRDCTICDQPLLSIVLPMSLVPLEFDENDLDVTVPLAKSVAVVALDAFPAKIVCDSVDYVRKCEPVASISKSTLTGCLELLDECLGTLYVKHKGQGWQNAKQDEMRDPALVYVWYEGVIGVACFVSFRIVSEPYGSSLYLYEIHVRPLLQGQQLGSKLIGGFHRLAETLCRVNSLSRLESLGRSGSGNVSDSCGQGPFQNKNESSSQVLSLAHYVNLPGVEHFFVSGSGLTVFGDNLRALKWYFGLGYVLSVHSPVDRILRGGKTIAPEYYILYRPVSR